VYCSPLLQSDRVIIESPKTEFLIGSTIEISCKAGYYKSKSAVITCESNQTWSIPSPDICQSRESFTDFLKISFIQLLVFKKTQIISLYLTL